jgi:DNA polymerase III subunit delta'
MDFSTIDGYQSSKERLKSALVENRVAHAQLLVAQNPHSTLALALWYVNELLDHHDSFGRLVHPDVHFVFPINSSPLVKKDPLCGDFMELFRGAVLENPYLSLNQWYAAASIEDKEALIKVDVVKELLKQLALKPVLGAYKIIVIWGAERMNTEASNKLLKVLEEPPKNTLFLLLTHREEQLLATITSRCQRLSLPPESPDLIAAVLTKKGIEPTRATDLATRAEGSIGQALYLLSAESEDVQFERLFAEWVRAAFKVKGDASEVITLLNWAEKLSALSKEGQKQFLSFAQGQIRSAMLLQYGASALVRKTEFADNFSLTKFAPFVHEENILDLTSLIETTLYNLSRNANTKILFADMALQMTKLIHQPSRQNSSS